MKELVATSAADKMDIEDSVAIEMEDISNGKDSRDRKEENHQMEGKCSTADTANASSLEDGWRYPLFF